MEPSLSGKTRILAACETSFNHRMAPALMDHVFPDKTQCESIFYLILNLLSTLVCKENHICLRQMGSLCTAPGQLSNQLIRIET